MSLQLCSQLTISWDTTVQYFKVFKNVAIECFYRCCRFLLFTSHCVCYGKSGPTRYIIWDHKCHYIDLWYCILLDCPASLRWFSLVRGHSEWLDEPTAANFEPCNETCEMPTVDTTNFFHPVSDNLDNSLFTYQQEFGRYIPGVLSRERHSGPNPSSGFHVQLIRIGRFHLVPLDPTCLMSRGSYQTTAKQVVWLLQQRLGLLTGLAQLATAVGPPEWNCPSM